MREKEKTQLHKDFELWASHQKELNGLTTKWYIEQYDHPKMAIAFIAFKAATALQAERVRELRRVLLFASCPEQCVNGAYHDHEGNEVRCQFCYEREQALSATAREDINGRAAL
jgi:hypothetical protein